jgi:hypothetical protein
METVKLGREGPQVGALGLGCMGMSPGIYGPADDIESVATLHRAIEAGVTLIDTGDFYGSGHNEMLIRRVLGETPRSRLTLSVKFGAMRDPAGGWGGNDCRPQAVKNFLAYSLTRYHHFGEGEYDQSERVIQRLLVEAGNANVPQDLVSINASGAEAAPSASDDKSPETYVGYNRASGFASPGGIVPDENHVYDPSEPQLNQWSLSGDWTVGGENATLDTKGGSIVYRFHARDLHLVLGPATDGAAIHFVVTIDGKSPGADHGADIDADGHGMVDGQRLYQTIRQQGAVADHTFEIQFLDPGAHAYAFTFG